MADSETELDSLSPTLSEQLTIDFYLWEKRGRGWQVWDDLVELEPVYEPFFYHYYPFRPVVDDGRRPTFFSSLFERLRNRLTGSSGTEEQDYTPALPESDFNPELQQPPVFTDDSALHEMTISLSPEQKVSLDYAENLFLNLSLCSLPLSFEIIGTSESSSIQFSCREPDLIQLRQQLNAYFPDAVVYKEGQSLECLWDSDKHAVVIDFGLSHEFMRPLRPMSL